MNEKRIEVNGGEKESDYRGVFTFMIYSKKLVLALSLDWFLESVETFFSKNSWITGAFQ